MVGAVLDLTPVFINNVTVVVVIIIIVSCIPDVVNGLEMMEILNWPVCGPHRTFELDVEVFDKFLVYPWLGWHDRKRSRSVSILLSKMKEKVFQAFLSLCSPMWFIGTG